MVDKIDGMPIERLFPGASKIEYVPSGEESWRVTMKLGEFKQRYESQKAEAEGNVRIVEAELERLKGVVLRLGGAVMAIDDLERTEAEELQKKLESHESLSEEDIQRTLEKSPKTVFEDGAVPEAEATSGAVPTCELPHLQEIKEN